MPEESAERPEPEDQSSKQRKDAPKEDKFSIGMGAISVITIGVYALYAKFSAGNPNTGEPNNGNMVVEDDVMIKIGDRRRELEQLTHSNSKLEDKLIVMPPTTIEDIAQGIQQCVTAKSICESRTTHDLLGHPTATELNGVRLRNLQAKVACAKKQRKCLEDLEQKEVPNSQKVGQ